MIEILPLSVFLPHDDALLAVGRTPIANPEPFTGLIHPDLSTGVPGV